MQKWTRASSAALAVIAMLTLNGGQAEARHYRHVGRVQYPVAANLCPLAPPPSLRVYPVAEWRPLLHRHNYYGPLYAACDRPIEKAYYSWY